MNGHWSYLKVFESLSMCQFLVLFFSQWYASWCPGKTVLILIIYCRMLVRKKKDKHLIQVISRMFLLFSLLPSETQLLMFSLLIYAFILRKDLISFLYFWAASLVKLYSNGQFWESESEQTMFWKKLLTKYWNHHTSEIYGLPGWWAK